VRARSVGEAIVALEKELPSLAGDVLVRGWPIAAYRISLNGKFFVTDPAEQLTDGDALVLVSADAGG
jgi:molybdopterin converting factor small subunit